MISDEAVEAAAQVLWDKEMSAPWSSVADGFKTPFLRDARAALEAAAPRIAAEAVREAAGAWREYLPAVAGYGKVQPVPVWLERRAKWIKHS